MMKKLLPIFLLLTYYNSFSQCELKTKRITVFKDATVFVEKEGTCNTDEKTLEIELPYQDQVPGKQHYSNHNKTRYIENNIILGTLEVETKDNKIISKQSTTDSKNDLPITSMNGILQKNINKEIEITLKASGEKIKGILFSVEQTGQSMRYGNKPGVLNGIVKNIILKQKDKWKIIDLLTVDYFEFVDKPEMFNESTRQKLFLNLEKNKTDQLVSLSYLRKGITWTPSYFISINSEKKLKLTLNANVMNDVETLSMADLNLAVGIPVFRFATIPAPLFSNDKVIDLINKINNRGQSRNQSARTSINSQSEMTFHNIALKESFPSNSYPSAEMEDDDDIFLYQLKNINLEIGDRANYNITEFETNYEDVYTVDLRSNNKFVSGSSSRNNEEENPMNVWHSIKFTNESEIPLTTGSVFFKKYKPNLKTAIPISQEKLHYTPVGETAIVKMAISPNIIIKESEREISRQKDTIHYQIGYNHGYLVTVKGEVEIINLKNEKIDMILDRIVKGVALLDSSEKWETMQSYRQLSQWNQTNIIQWNTSVEANSKKVISYTYQVHIRR